MQLKIAMFCPPGADLSETATIYPEVLAKHTSYVQRTEFVAVEFQELDRTKTIARELEVLDEMESIIRTEAQAKIEQVQDQRKKLLAIGYRAEVSA